MPVALFSTAVLSTALGSWVLYDRPSKALNKAFFLLCLSIAGWAAVIGFSQLSYHDGLARGSQSIGLGYFFGSAIPYLFYVTCRSFHGTPKTGQIYSIVALIWCLFSIYLGFTGSIVSELKIVEGKSYYEFVTGPGFSVFLSYVIFMGGLCAKEIFVKYRTASNRNDQLQIIYFGVGSGLPFIVALICNVLLPTFGFSTLSPYGATSPIIALGILSVAITQHHLLDMKIARQWSTSVCLWILALWVPLTIYLLLSTNVPGHNFPSSLILMLGLTTWMVVLYLFSRSNESKFFPRRETDSKRPCAMTNSLSEYEETELTLRQELIDALIHDLSSKLTLAVIEAKRGRSVDSSQLMENYRETLSQLRGVSELLSSGRAVSARQTCDLSEVVSDVFKSRNQLIKTKSIKIDVESLPEIESDRTAIRYVFANVIDNAINYVGDKEYPSIRIYSKTFSGGIQIFIQDNGIGMNERELRRVLRPLYRGRNQMVNGRNVEGTGIGLTIVSRLLSKLNGEIRITSREKVGTSVCIRLNRM